MKIIVAGGGIAGLASARALAGQGHQIILLEQAAAFGEVGAGLQISPNGMRVIAALGLEDEVRAVAFEPSRIELRFGQSGQVIFDVPLSDRSMDRWGAPYLHVHRADLLDVLVRAADANPSIDVRFGTRVQSCHSSLNEVEVHLNHGEVCSADVLIGADGIHSIVREQMLGPDVPRFTGCIAWRGVVEMDKLKNHPPPPTACAWVGKGKHAVTYQLRGGKLANIVGVVERSDWRQESWSEAGIKAAFLKDFEGWHPIITNMIEQGDDYFRWALFDRAPLRRWVDGRVALIGDAAHPMLPFVAQGAVMALEDAWMLGRCLHRHAHDAPDALRTYEAKRHARATHVQRLSSQNKTTFHHSNPVSRLSAYGPMWLAGHLLPEIVHQRFDWIYGYDVTA